MAAAVLMTVLILAGCAVTCRSTTTPADRQKAAVDARLLINASNWGVVSSLDYLNGNAPFGNAVAYADGGRGTPYFLLTLFDRATANFSRADSRTALTVSEFALGSCGIRDPQEPTCVKVTLSGQLVRIDPRTAEGKFANSTLLQRHPRFKQLPAFLKFELYKLKLSRVFVLNAYGEPKYPSVKRYLGIKI